MHQTLDQMLSIRLNSEKSNSRYLNFVTSSFGNKKINIIRNEANKPKGRIIN